METKLHIASFNAENFYLLLDRRLDREELDALGEADYLAMNASIYNPNKERSKIAEIARIILEEDFDLVGLCEVGGMETLSAFNRLYLGGRYECRLHEENSTRGIFVGALLKKGRFPGARARNMGGSFSRNLLRLDLGREGGSLAVFVVHLKSQHGADRGIEKRMKEVEKLCALVRMRNCVIMGDFNGIAIRGEQQFEYDPILALPFRDVLEAVGIPAEKRRTHYYFGGGEANFAQLDYIFCSNDIEIADAAVIEGEIPLNRTQRECLPSDHLFLRATIVPAGAGETARAERTVHAPDCVKAERTVHAPDSVKAERTVHAPDSVKAERTVHAGKTVQANRPQAGTPHAGAERPGLLRRIAAFLRKLSGR